MIILHGGFLINYNITWGGDLANQNLYYVIYGRPLYYDILGQKFIFVLMVLYAKDYYL